MTKEELPGRVVSKTLKDNKGREFILGGSFITDSIRLDMDGGRLIISQKNSPSYESNKLNWKQELEFAKKL